jgi:magnesium and cobalt transporter
MTNDDSSPSSSPRENGAADTPSLSKTILSWLRGLGGARHDDGSLRESLELLIEEHANHDQPIDPEERLMLMNILKLNELRVDDVMVPRADIVAVEQQSTLEEVLTVVRKELHSRTPVYRETLDDVVGMVHVKDLLVRASNGSDFSLDHLMRDTLFVPPSMHARELLLKMRKSRVHMAVVVDEYGGTDGLVTIEDLVEEIVGEIEDEHDVEEGPLLVEGPENTLDADARTPIEQLEEILEQDLIESDRDEDIDTLGGLVFALVGRVPRIGERVKHPGGAEFEVLDADARRVKRLRIWRPRLKSASA